MVRNESIARLLENANKLVTDLGCEYEILENAKNITEIMEKYNELLSIGKANGFTPVIIVPCDVLNETLEFSKQDNVTRDDILAKAKEIDGRTFIMKKHFIDYAPDNSSEDEFIKNLEAEAQINPNDVSFPTGNFISLNSYDSNVPYPVLLIAKIPTLNPWEVAAWIPMGGFNDCPSPATQVAVFKYWYEQYGAYPAVVTYDIWECYVEKPADTNEKAASLAVEQFCFCTDIVWQGVGNLNKLTNSLLDSHIWYFWWD